MRIRLAFACATMLLLQGCVTSGGSVWAIDASAGRHGPGYWPYPSPYPGQAVPYGYHPYSRFEPSPFWGGRPGFPYRHPHRCARDRWGRVWC
jgi:hypothetical protein